MNSGVLIKSKAIRQWFHDDVIKWKLFPRYWPFVRRIHRSPVNSPHKGQWRGALMLSLISVWINDWVNNGEAGDLRRYRIHYDVTVMFHGWHSHECKSPTIRFSGGIWFVQMMVCHRPIRVKTIWGNVYWKISLNKNVHSKKMTSNLSFA